MMRRGGSRFGPSRNEDKTRVNERIRAPQVRVIGADGDQLGVMPIKEAQRLAEEAELDLVEVAPNASPPVCRMMDYGRYRYEQQKKARAKQKNTGGDQKELRMKPSIEDHDYQTKLRHAKAFLEDGNRVKLTVRFRGRELAHRDLGRDLLDRFAGDLKEVGKVDGRIYDEGRNVSVNVVPAKSSG